MELALSLHDSATLPTDSQCSHMYSCATAICDLILSVICNTTSQ